MVYAGKGWGLRVPIPLPTSPLKGEMNNLSGTACSIVRSAVKPNVSETVLELQNSRAKLPMLDDLRLLGRLLRLSRRYWTWMALGAFISTVTMLANVGLMAIAGWFLAAMAVAGAAGVLMNYFLPAALIRLFAILRTGGRYLERLVTHEATFRLLSELRVWFYRRIEPLAPARLQHTRGSDLLSRIQADIDTLHHAYLRVLVPILVAVFGIAVVTAVLGLLQRLDRGARLHGAALVRAWRFRLACAAWASARARSSWLHERRCARPSSTPSKAWPNCGSTAQRSARHTRSTASRSD